MRRSKTITLDHKIFSLLKRISRKTNIPESHLIEIALLEKYKDTISKGVLEGIKKRKGVKL